MLTENVIFIDEEAAPYGWMNLGSVVCPGGSYACTFMKEHGVNIESP